MSNDTTMRRLSARLGVFVFVGCLASWLVVLISGSWSVAIPLVIAIWAFCRAAHLTVRLSEPPTTERSIATRLLLLGRRMLAGQDLRIDGDARIDGWGLPPTAGISARAFYGLLLKLACLAAISCLLAPSLYEELIRPAFRGARRDYIFAAWISWLVACAAICILFGALLNAPFKYRAPLSCTALFLIAVSLLLGMKFTNDNFNSSDVWVILVFAGAVYLIGFTVLWLYRWKWSWSIQLPAENPAEDASDFCSGEQNQVSITYMIALMTGIAVAIALLKFLFPSGIILPRGDEVLFRMLMVFLMGATILLALAAVTISLLHLILSDGSRRTREHVALIAILATVFPYAFMIGLEWLEPSPRTPSQAEFVSMYVFFIGYIAILGVLLHVLANAGLRLERSPDYNGLPGAGTRKSDP